MRKMLYLMIVALLAIFLLACPSGDHPNGSDSGGGYSSRDDSDGGGSGGDNPSGDDNPFIGTWENDGSPSLVMVLTDTDYTLDNGFVTLGGPYTYTDTAITFTLAYLDDLMPDPPTTHSSDYSIANNILTLVNGIPTGSTSYPIYETVIYPFGDKQDYHTQR